MTLGVIGKKVGMTQIFDEQGLAIPVTVIKVDETVVTQVKTVETDGYNAIQVGTIAAKEKHLTKAQLGHFKKNNLSNYRHLQEFRVDNPQDYKVGDKVELSVLDNIEKVDVTGKSIGKGFQGTVKRHNFGRGPMAHGSKNHREPALALPVPFCFQGFLPPPATSALVLAQAEPWRALFNCLLNAKCIT